MWSKRLVEVLARLRPRTSVDADVSLAPAAGSSCSGCGAAVGQIHSRGCDVERCSVCGGQRLFCDCPGHEPALEVWTGEWPGVDECRRRGWHAVFVPGQGWLPCAPDAPGARPDLNRLAFFRAHGYDGNYDES
jgi:hypothetical protein